MSPTADGAAGSVLEKGSALYLHTWSYRAGCHYQRCPHVWLYIAGYQYTLCLTTWRYTAGCHYQWCPLIWRYVSGYQYTICLNTWKCIKPCQSVHILTVNNTAFIHNARPCQSVHVLTVNNTAVIQRSKKYQPISKTQPSAVRICPRTIQCKYSILWSAQFFFANVHSLYRLVGSQI